MDGLHNLRRSHLWLGPTDHSRSDTSGFVVPKSNVNTCSDKQKTSQTVLHHRFETSFKYTINIYGGSSSVVSGFLVAPDNKPSSLSPLIPQRLYLLVALRLSHSLFPLQSLFASLHVSVYFSFRRSLYCSCFLTSVNSSPKNSIQTQVFPARSIRCINLVILIKYFTESEQNRIRYPNPLCLNNLNDSAINFHYKISAFHPSRVLRTRVHRVSVSFFLVKLKKNCFYSRIGVFCRLFWPPSSVKPLGPTIPASAPVQPLLYNPGWAENVD